MADNYKSVNKSLVLDNVTRQHKQNVRIESKKVQSHTKHLTILLNSLFKIIVIIVTQNITIT